MTKIGRNEPCPCGSGKKYKNCCLQKDQAADLGNAKEVNGNGWKIDHDRPGTMPVKYESYAEYLEMLKGLTDEEYEEYMSEYEDEEDIYEDDFYDDLTDEQIQLINNWWDEFYELSDSDEIIAHIKAFIVQYPDLVPHLELYEEALTTLSENSLEEDNFEKYVDFIRLLYKIFPQEVISDGGLIELNILTWLLAKDRTEDIPEFLQPFQEHPMDYASTQEHVVETFLLQNKAEYIMPTLLNTYQFIWESEDTINPYVTLHPIIADYIDRHYHDVSARDMIRFLTNKITVEINEVVLEESFWEAYFKSVKRPYEKWPDTKPNDELEAVDLCRRVCENYMRFLKERLGLQFTSAEYLALKVNQYLLEFIDRNKTVKNIFSFNYRKMLKAIEHTAGGYLLLDYVKLISILNGLYYFTDYLQECGNLSAEKVLKIKSDLGKIHNSNIEEGLENEFESMLFQDFPIIY